jgi:hypothetical protein
MNTVRIIGIIPEKPNWTDRMSRESWHSWAGLEALLRADPKWESDQVDSVAAESLRVLRHMHDPAADFPFQSRGLVVGYVQSGKTANYTAVAARAVDAGYRIIIVLSGIHDSLRNQTQKRLERELVRDESIDLSQNDRRLEWRTLTTATEDFAEQDVRINKAGESAFAGINPMSRQTCGLGFFPGGDGLWKEHDSIEPMTDDPRKIMVGFVTFTSSTQPERLLLHQCLSGATPGQEKHRQQLLLKRSSRQRASQFP